MVIANCLLHDESCLHRAIICELVFLLNILKGQNVYYALRIVLHDSMAFRSLSE